MKIRTHASVETGHEYDVDALRAEFLPANTWEKGMYGSDMDWTMVLNDTGALLFVKYLMRPNFYRFKPDVLHEMLLPDIHVGDLSTREFITRGAEAAYPGVNPADCSKALQAREDITRTYADIRGMMLDGGPKTEIQKAELQGFVRMVVELDALLIALKNQYSCAVTSNKMAAAFSRYRLFGGQETGMIGDTIQTLLDMDPAHPERYLNMRVGDRTHSRADQRVVINAPIYTLLSDIHREGAEGQIVTASPYEVAQTIVRGSVYRTLLTPEQIIATQLEKSPGGLHLSGRLDGPMMASNQKADALGRVAAAKDKEIKLALGDMPGSDAPMGALALRNGGVLIVAHGADEIEQSRHGFDMHLRRILGSDLEKHQERIWYIPTAPHEDAQ